MTVDTFGPVFMENHSTSLDFRSQVTNPSKPEQNLLVISPYVDEPHLLDLRTLDIQDQLLARALTSLHSLREDYATAPYIETFNWGDVTKQLQNLCREIGHAWEVQIYYIVVFRSQVLDTTDYSQLGILDKAAHKEAVQSGGFLKYWFGSPDGRGRNLATCVWRNQQDARLGGRGEAHRRAAEATRHSYTSWKIERLVLEITDGALDWEIRDWVD